MTPTPNRPVRRDAKTPIPSDPNFGTIPVDAIKYQITAHYPARLRPNRVETITVSVSPLQGVDRALDVGRKKNGDAIPLRLVIPGAILLPSEQTLTPTPFGTSEVVFHVTAFAEGDLPNCRLEVARHGKLEAIPLPLRSEGNAMLAVLAVLTFVVPLLLYLPTCWPGLAESGDVERFATSWIPGSPLFVGQVAREFYSFLASTGKSISLSFFTFLALLGWTAVWSSSRRPMVKPLSNEPFLLLPGSSHTKVGPLPSLLSPVSTDDIGEPHR